MCSPIKLEKRGVSDALESTEMIGGGPKIEGSGEKEGMEMEEGEQGVEDCGL